MQTVKLNSVQIIPRIQSLAGCCRRLKQLFILMQSLLQTRADSRGLSGRGLHQVWVETNDEAPGAGVHLPLAPAEGGDQGGESFQDETHLGNSVSWQRHRSRELLISNVFTENLLEPVQEARHGQLVGDLAVLAAQVHLVQQLGCLVQLAVPVHQGMFLVIQETVLQ